MRKTGLGARGKVPSYPPLTDLLTLRTHFKAYNDRAPDESMPDESLCFLMVWPLFEWPKSRWRKRQAFVCPNNPSHETHRSRPSTTHILRRITLWAASKELNWSNIQREQGLSVHCGETRVLEDEPSQISVSIVPFFLCIWAKTATWRLTVLI